jgi:hypothetical protein
MNLDPCLPDPSLFKALIGGRETIARYRVYRSISNLEGPVESSEPLLVH